MPEARERSTLKLAIVGGSGRVGSALRRELAPLVGSIAILDLLEPSTLADNEIFLRLDLQDVGGLRDAFAGLDGVVHLAGIPKEAPLEDILRVNVAGTTNVYEAARAAGVPRVVLGSSNHAVGYYPRDVVVSPDSPMRPDGLYGLSKCWGELVAGLYYDKYGIRSLIVRIGNAAAHPRTRRALEVWLSPADMCQLTLLGLTHPDVDATTVFGVSGGGGSWWDNAAAAKLGYRPCDIIADHAPAALAQDDENGIAQHFQGGRFAAAGHRGGIRRR